MPRTHRIVLPGVPHHVTHKGINGQSIFINDSDKKRYLAILKDRCALYGFSIEGYCLMRNHIHIVGTPDVESSLYKAVGGTHRQYSRLFNIKHGLKGKLWQDRFYSCALDESHFIQALVYVDQNPVRAGLVMRAENYRWSSAAAHSGELDSSGLINPDRWKKIAEAYDWDGIIRLRLRDEIMDEIRRHTMSGKPLGLAAGMR